MTALVTTTSTPSHTMKRPYTEMEPPALIEDDNSSTTRKRAKPSRRVHFSDTITVRHRSVSSTDLQNAWYHDKDYDAFEQDVRHTVAAIRVSLKRRSTKLNPAVVTLKGLEDLMTTEHQKYRDYLKGRHQYYILNEQHSLRLHGLVCPESIHAVSVLYSRESTDRAIQRGLPKTY